MLHNIKIIIIINIKVHMIIPLNINIFIPSLNKTKMKAIQILDENNCIISRGLLTLCFLLLLRAQISNISEKKKIISQEKLPLLDTAKWTATTISKNSNTYNLACLLAIGDSLQYLINTNEDEITAENIKEKAIQKWEEIKKQRPIPGSRILPPSLINSNTLNPHIYGTVLQYIGKWQAISLYDQNTLLKGAPILIIDFEKLSLIFHNLMDNLEIPIEEKLCCIENQIQFIENELYSTEVILLDNINLGLEDNKLPLEKNFKVKRIAPKENTNIKLSERDSDNPLIKLLALNLNQNKEGKLQKEKQNRFKKKK